METLTYGFKDIDFKGVMKAQFRKYFDDIYKGKNLVVDIHRKLIDKDILEIYRVHSFDFFIMTSYFVEKIYIDRKKNTYRSEINSYYYSEQCLFREKGKDVEYIQNFSISSFYRSKKVQAFEVGCNTLEKIIHQLKEKIHHTKE
jgi:hypothetical protein